jgi:hypothetical protein
MPFLIPTHLLKEIAACLVDNQKVRQNIDGYNQKIQEAKLRNLNTVLSMIENALLPHRQQRQKSDGVPKGTQTT